MMYFEKIFVRISISFTWEINWEMEMKLSRHT